MPEGDTIWRAAAALRAALAGRVITAFRTTSPDISPAAERAVLGRSVTKVEARGKHLLMTFARGDDELVLHTHMRMNGEWHIYRAGERWRRSASRARAIIETDSFVAPCFDAPVIELLRAQDVAHHPALVALGPDAMTDAFDVEESLSRLRAAPERELAVALLDQRTVAGLGNVLKSEALFTARVSPFARVADLDDEALRALLLEGHRLLRTNRTVSGRRTRFVLDGRQRLWVYGRAGEPCHVCAAPIGSAAQGEDARRTYWCPVCQAGVGANTSGSRLRT